MTTHILLSELNYLLIVVMVIAFCSGQIVTIVGVISKGIVPRCVQAVSTVPASVVVAVATLELKPACKRKT